MSVMVDAARSVTTAAADCPGESTVPVLSQVIVIGPLALTGLQLLVDMPRVNETPVPVFLTYIVLVTVLPGVIVPQSSEVKALLQPTSENTLNPGEVAIVPPELKYVLMLVAPKVATDKVNPTNINANAVTLGKFLFAICYPSYSNTCVLSLNKHY
jgi:hypothetical protein